MIKYICDLCGEHIDEEKEHERVLMTADVDFVRRMGAGQTLGYLSLDMHAKCFRKWVQDNKLKLQEVEEL